MSRYFIVRDKEKGTLVGVIRDTPEKAIKWMSEAYNREYEIMVELTQEEWNSINKGNDISIDKERINN